MSTQRGDKVSLDGTPEMKVTATPILEHGQLLILVEAINDYGDFKDPRLSYSDLRQMLDMYAEAEAGLGQ